MTAQWEAPRTAYLLTAATASGDNPGARVLWRSLDRIEQADVLAALGAQARLQARMAMQAAGTDAGSYDITKLGHEICRNALLALRELMQDSPGPWELPECTHCAELVAYTLTEMSTSAARQGGMAPDMFAQLCRHVATGLPDMLFQAIAEPEPEPRSM